MRKIAKSAVVLLTLAVGVLLATPAHAAGVAVLTTGSLGGPNVAVGDVITSGLKSGTSATFTSGSSSVTCSASQFTVTVVTNPDAGNVATETLTAQTFSSCTAHITGVTGVQSITVNNLTYDASVDGTSKAITLSAGSTGPIQATIKLSTILGTVTCAYRPNSGTIAGTTNNTDNSLAFSGQSLTKSSGSGLCPSTSTFDATYAPASDSSVTGTPAVFVQ